MLWIVGAAVAVLAAGVLAAFVTADFTEPYRRWVAGSWWRRFVIVAVLACLTVAGALMQQAGEGRSPRKPVVPTGPARPLSWDEKAAAEQSRVDVLRIGMTKEEVHHRLGPPSGRFAAPPNPYGIDEELVYSNGMTTIQLLLGEVDSVVYFAVTALDVALRLETPVRYYPPGRLDAAPQLFVLNETKLATVDFEGAEPVGYIGASWMNFALVWGGSHAANWRYDAVGYHVGAEQTRRGAPIDPGEAGVVAPLIDAIIVARQWGEGDPEVNERRRVDVCVRELSSETMAGGPEAAGWWRHACESSKPYTDEEVRRLRSAPQWQQFIATATADTFATTAPELFAEFPAAVFYSIFDLGPRETSIP